MIEGGNASLTGRIDARLDDRLVWTIAVALVVVHLILAWQAREIGLISAQDDGRYILLARSLRDFTYRDLYLVGLPYHSSYPPLYPATLAVWASLFGESFGGFVTMNVLMSGGALIVAFAAVKRGWSACGALLCLAVMAINPFLVIRPGGVRSETLYIALSYFALWALAAERPSRRLLWVAGTAAIAAGLTRSVGLALVGAIGIMWLLERRYKAVVLFGVAAAVTVGAWMLWGLLAPEQVVGYHYFADALTGAEAAAPGLVSAFGDRMTKLLPNYAGLTIPWVLAAPTVPGTPVDNLVISVLMLAGIVVGLVRLYRRWPVAVIYMLLYGVLLVAWPYHRPRFMEPLIPLLLATLMLGIGTIVNRIRSGWAVPAMGVVAVVLACGSAMRTADFVQLRDSCGPFSLAEPPECLQVDRASLLRAIDFIGRDTPDTALFVTAKPEPLYYYTGRRSVLLQGTFSGDRNTYVDGLRRLGVDYVVLGSTHVDELRRLAPRLERQCEQLEVEAFFPPRTYLFRIRNGSAPGEPAACEAIEHHRNANTNRRFVDDRG